MVLAQGHLLHMHCQPVMTGMHVQVGCGANMKLVVNMIMGSMCVQQCRPLCSWEPLQGRLTNHVC